jgi:hypothetical protein
MQLHNFIICSLMSLSFSNISTRSQQTGPHSLQQTRIYRYTYNNFIFYLSLPQHASYMWLSLFKKSDCTMSNNTAEFYLPRSYCSSSEWGTDNYSWYINPVQVYTIHFHTPLHPHENDLQIPWQLAFVQLLLCIKKIKFVNMLPFLQLKCRITSL